MLKHIRNQLSIPGPFQGINFWVIGFATLVFVFIWLFPFHPVGVGLKGYAPLHILLETFSITIAGIIFAVGWHARLARDAHVLALLAVGFLGVALLDVAHVLSFQNMPEWFTPSGGGKAIYFWFLARYLAAFTILAFVLNLGKHKNRNKPAWLALTAILVLVVFSCWIVLAHQDWLPVFIIPGDGLTPMKIYLEWLLTLIFFATVILVWRRRDSANFYDPGSLIAALALSGLSELCFTLYSNAADIISLLGHVYKVLSYGFLYHAIVARGVKLPYELLSQSQEILQQLMDNVRQVFFMTSADRKEMLYISPAYETIWQRPCSDVLDSPLSWLDAVHPDDIDRVRQHLSLQLQEHNSIDFRILRPDGTVRNIRTRSFPIRDEHGIVMRIAGVSEDLTDEIQTRQALRHEESLLQQTQEIAHLGSWELDLVNNELTWSDEVYRIFGLKPKEFPASYGVFLDTVHPDDRAKVDTAYRGSVEEGRDGYEIEHRIIRKQTNEVRYLHEKCTHIRNVAGDVVRSIGMVHDITDRKLAELEQANLQAQLAQAQKMEAIGQLTGGIAHDFNNVLAAIVGYTGMLGRFNKDNIDFEKYKSFLKEISTASHRAKDLISQMLIYSRLKSNNGIEDSSVIVLKPVFKEIMQLLRLSIPSTIDIHYEVTPEDLTAYINPVQLQQILMNLAINARDACREYGEIEIKAEKARRAGICSACHGKFDVDYIVLSVRDTGCGITADIIDRIFDPFFSTKEIGKGSGMGLSVVHGMVHSNGGHVLVQSGGENQGTTIQVLLQTPPVALEEYDSNAVDIKQIKDQKLLKNFRIMVVDDEPSVARMLRELLEYYSANVSVYTDSPAALKAFKEAPDNYDLVITDETMPKLSGSDMSRALLELRRKLPIILCTGYSENVTDESVRKIGIAAMMPKPVDDKQLVEKIAMLLN